MSEQATMYINKCRSYIRFMLYLQQWSGLNKSDIDRWLENFKDFNDEDMSLVYKLLTNIIYFSEEDVIDLLTDGIFNHLFGDIILTEQLTNNFQLSPKALSNLVKDRISKTCFTPLLDSNAPHESGNYITRLMVQQGLIQSSQSIFLNQLIDALQKYKCSHLVIVDDCVGSGDQLRGYWNKACIFFEGKEFLLKDFCAKNSIDVDYLVLFGYNRSIDNLKKELIGLNIHCVKQLSDTQRAFTDDSYLWENETEAQNAYNLLQKITAEHGIELLGYQGLDFTFIMHKTVPDWTLPLFWRNTPDWKCLLRRKNSSV